MVGRTTHACHVFHATCCLLPRVQVRDLQNSFFNQLTSVAMTVFEKYNQENSDVESLPEDARTLLQVRLRRGGGLVREGGVEGEGDAGEGFAGAHTCACRKKRTRFFSCKVQGPGAARREGTAVLYVPVGCRPCNLTARPVRL